MQLLGYQTRLMIYPWPFGRSCQRRYTYNPKIWCNCYSQAFTNLTWATVQEQQHKPQEATANIKWRFSSNYSSDAARKGGITRINYNAPVLSKHSRVLFQLQHRTMKKSSKPQQSKDCTEQQNSRNTMQKIKQQEEKRFEIWMQRLWRKISRKKKQKNRERVKLGP